MIEVFVRSHDRYVDVGEYREMSYHWECGLAQWAYSNLAEQFKGRLLSEEDQKVLEKVLETARERNEKIMVRDISRLSGRFEALKRGVIRTPTVIIDGVRCTGFEEISQRISSKHGP